MKRASKESVKMKADRAEALSKGEPLLEPSTAGVDPTIKISVAMGSASTPAPPPSPERRKRGRPSKFKPEMCEQVVELGDEGLSKAQIERALGISEATRLTWEKTHPEFLRAIKQAERLAMAWWEEQGQSGIHEGKSFNATAFIFQMKNRFPSTYRDKHEVSMDASQAFAQLWRSLASGKLPKVETEGEEA